MNKIIFRSLFMVQTSEGVKWSQESMKSQERFGNIVCFVLIADFLSTLLVVSNPGMLIEHYSR